MAEQELLLPPGWDDWNQATDQPAVHSFGLVTPGLAMAAADQVRFLDVSHWQNDRGRIDYAKVKAAGYVAVVAKQTEGTGFVDRWGTWNITEAAKHGLVAGGYHFLRAGSSGRAQFDFFLDRLKQAGPLEGRIVALDVETAGNGTDPDYELADNWAQWCKTELGILPWMYYPRWHMTKMHQCPQVHGPWWQSAFGPSPGQPMCGFTRVAAWQHTSTGTIPGISGHVDLNRWMGDLASLKATTIGSEEDDMPLTEAEKAELIRRTKEAVLDGMETILVNTLRNGFGGVHPGATTDTVRGSQQYLYGQVAGQAARLQTIEDTLASLAPALGDPAAIADQVIDRAAARLAPRP